MEKPSESSPLKDFCKNENRNMRERHKEEEEGRNIWKSSKDYIEMMSVKVKAQKILRLVKIINNKKNYFYL